MGFPFLFGGTFIEALEELKGLVPCGGHFPSFSEGLSLRPVSYRRLQNVTGISLPFGMGFH